MNKITYSPKGEDKSNCNCHNLSIDPNGFEKYLTQNNIQDLQSKVPFNIDRTDEDNQGPAGHGKGFFDADLVFIFSLAAVLQLPGLSS